MPFSFPKSEKLCGALRIKSLYVEGKSFVRFPLRVTYRYVERQDELQPPLRVLVWAPKSRFRHAVDRNRLRRQMREAYRLHATPLRERIPQNKQLQVAINYISSDMLPYAVIEKAMRQALEKIAINK